MSDDSIQGRLQSDLTAAMKAKDADTLSTLRMLKTALMEAKTKKPKDATLSADEEIEVLQRYVKKRRTETVPREEQEIEITQRYLPQALSEAELRAIVKDVVAKTGAVGPKEMGKVIGGVMAQVKGKAEGTQVSKLVKEALGG
jgi:uncharacterized protein YqeY